MSYVVFAVVTLVILLIRYLRRHYGILEQCGIPVIAPYFIGGSGPFKWHTTSFMDLDHQRVKKYGKIYGSYLVTKPVITVADPEFIRLITTKEFDKFPGHRPFVKEQDYRTLDTTVGEEWKSLRKNLSPIFSSGKIKSMLELLNQCIDNMINHIDERIDENPEINMKETFQKMTLEGIGRAVFGVEIEAYKGTHELTKLTQEAFADFMIKDWKSNTLVQMFMGMDWISDYISMLPPAMVKMTKFVQAIEDSREEKDLGTKGDFIDKLMELKKMKKRGEIADIVTENQITNQGIIFLIAGHETSANTLSSSLYCLVNNPESYDQLQSEIDQTFEDFEGRLDHETVAEMPYLDAFIKETLRMYGPVARNDRMCEKEFHYKGMTIPPGTPIEMLYHVIHSDPEYWPEPHVFRPERFLKENAADIVPYSWLPFGSGPRACIGERFAMIEIKMALAKLLYTFKLEKTKNTRMDLFKGDLFLYGYTDMMIQFSRRA